MISLLQLLAVWEKGESLGCCQCRRLLERSPAVMGPLYCLWRLRLDATATFLRRVFGPLPRVTSVLMSSIPPATDHKSMLLHLTSNQLSKPSTIQCQQFAIAFSYSRSCPYTPPRSATSLVLAGCNGEKEGRLAAQQPLIRVQQCIQLADPLAW